MRAAFDSDYGPYLGHPLDPRSEDGPSDCPDCDGSGKSAERIEFADGTSDLLDCPTCKGMGSLDEAGVPVRLNCWGDRDYGRGFAS